MVYMSLVVILIGQGSRDVIGRLSVIIRDVIDCEDCKKSGAPDDGFLSDPLKRYFRLSGVPLKLCRFILGCAIIFLSVRSF